jgi:adenylate cyclase, class 2
MPQETEIKLKITDARAFHRALKRIAARPVAGGPRVHEENVIFDTPQGGLAKHGQLLRIRTETTEGRGGLKARGSKRRIVVTFKQPIAGSAGVGIRNTRRGSYKVRDETELEVSDPVNLTRIFEGLGMSGWFRYEKYRSTFQLPSSKSWGRGLLIEVDETPIGTFVELEGPADAIDRAATELGFSKQDYVVKNYLVLYMEDCRRKGEQPSHMLFPPKQKPQK